MQYLDTATSASECPYFCQLTRRSSPPLLVLCAKHGKGHTRNSWVSLGLGQFAIQAEEGLWVPKTSRQSPGSLLREPLVAILHETTSFDSPSDTSPLFVSSLRYLDPDRGFHACRSIHPTSNDTIPRAFYVKPLRGFVHIPKEVRNINILCSMPRADI